MHSIFKDEGRLAGDCSARPEGVWPKSALASLPPLESAMHFLRADASREQIWAQTVIRTDCSQVS